jgi:murein L,D-transpeptidase YcbB/YkuD
MGSGFTQLAIDIAAKSTESDALSRFRIPRSAWVLTAAAVFLAPTPSLAAKKKDKEAAPVVRENLLVGFSQGAAVQAYYKRWRGPQWFKESDGAAAKLATILRRARLEGLPQGEALAVQVEDAARQAATLDKRALAEAEQILSAAWVSYVEVTRRPVPDMIYGYATLAPKPARADEVLAAAAGAQSLAQHLDEVSAVNPLYASLRDAAWAQFNANPAIAPDPRIAMNLARLRSVPRTERFALVNIASQMLVMYENGKPVDTMRVVVGTNELPTPMISSVIFYATFNPYWNVPEHLVRKTVAPNVIKTGMSYLTTRGYQVMTNWAVDAATIPPTSVNWNAVASGSTRVRVRQLPNASNSMGKIKFSFDNGEGIFLHDTPAREYFAKPERALSNGCVRLQDAARFGRWLLRREAAAPSALPEQFVPLPVGVPVYLTYLTAQETGGKVTFLKDIYGWDSGGSFQPLGVTSNLAR